METLTRLVAESLARHGFERPVDFRRLQWSRWIRCESHHSLLVVPSKPGVFALAEEVMDIGAKESAVPEAGSPKAEARRMLAVSQFFEDDDMAFVLDRMLSYENPMRARLASGRYFIRFVAIEDASQRRSICNALNQWIVSSAEKATGIGSHFASSLELAHESVEERCFSPSDAQLGQQRASGAHVEERRFSAASARQDDAALAAVPPTQKTAEPKSNSPQSDTRRVNSAPTLNSAVATNIHCSSSFPSGF